MRQRSKNGSKVGEDLPLRQPGGGKMDCFATCDDVELIVVVHAARVVAMGAHCNVRTGETTGLCKTGANDMYAEAMHKNGVYR